MYWDHMQGWSWLWGTLMMGVILGLVVYLVVKLAQGGHHGRSR